MKRYAALIAVSAIAISFNMLSKSVYAQEANEETPALIEPASQPESALPVAEEDEKPRPVLVKSATGYDVPMSQVSNDITVITKEEIAHLPVNDVADVLNYMTGVSISRGGGPGTYSALSIQGSNYNHIKVMIDNIPIEPLATSFSDTSILDLNSVERIEVLKGAASSVWGSSIGGVINIITRKPSETFMSEGSVSAGENSTNRVQASISGTAGAGYYLSAKRLETDGFSENQRAKNSNFYGKLTKDLSKSLEIEASYEYEDIKRDESGWSAAMGGRVEEVNIDRRGRLQIAYTPHSNYEVVLDGYVRAMDFNWVDNTGATFAIDNEVTYGGGATSVWRHSDNGTFSAGVESSTGEIVKYSFFSSDVDYTVSRNAAFANESFSISDLTFNAGLRHDDDSVYGSETSPSAGVVYRAGEKTFFRLNAARGFTPPPVTYKYYGTTPNIDLNAERAWTYQAGIEHDFLSALWSKFTVYRADFTDGIVCDSVSCQNIGKMKRQGFEVDIKTREYKGLVVSYGYAFNDVRDETTDQIIKGMERVTHNMGVAYSGPYNTMLNMQGHYIYWNTDSSMNAKDQTVLWDAKVSKYLARWNSVVGEIFVSIHNITDQNQYWNEGYPNPGRWVEAGVTLTTF